MIGAPMRKKQQVAVQRDYYRTLAFTKKDMKELTREEFEDRISAIQRARKIFINSGLTKNITTAYQLYQEIFAERKREIFLSTQAQGNRLLTIMDKYERPKCPDCNSDMMFRQVLENKEGIKIQLVCSNQKCQTVLNSKEDLAWWMKNLKRK